ncbi:hypothetical protein METSCH_B01660 [Metschnikowia aff. pulcherrima]|uniref:Uncharacterized protein n=1 Tax=Metschnikowia aff. pulcherrima TaxID=2163413 RepID=A0A4V1ADU9_9ASCO|nr:hypothetical protein METSCH_B01660 [Metschnikowia aff. pulcherrima]
MAKNTWTWVRRHSISRPHGSGPPATSSAINKIMALIKYGINSTDVTLLELFNSNRLGQVAGEVHINASVDSQPVTHQLQRNNVQQTLQAVNSQWHMQGSVGFATHHVISLIADDNRPSVSSRHLLNC